MVRSGLTLLAQARGVTRSVVDRIVLPGAHAGRLQVARPCLLGWSYQKASSSRSGHTDSGPHAHQRWQTYIPSRDGAAVVDSHAARWAHSIREPRRMRARPSAVTPPLHCQQPALVILQRSFEISRVVRLRLGRKAALSRCMESRSARLATCTQEPVLLSREWTASQDDESGPGLAGWSDAPVRYGTAAGPYWDPTEIRR